MALVDLFFGVDVVNRTGRNNIRGDELAALLAADPSFASPRVGQGALVRQGVAGQSIPNGVATDIDLTAGGGASIDYDDLGFFVAPDRFVIPAVVPPIQRVIVSVGVFWLSGAGTFRRLRTEKNGAGPLTDQSMQQNDVQPIAAIQTAMAVDSLPTIAVAGDFFEFNVTHNDGGALFINEVAASILVVK